MAEADFPAWHADSRLPTDDPFTTAEARRLGVQPNVLARMVRDGSLRRLVRGVYVDAAVADSVDQRARALALAVPDAAVVTDETAAWLYGLDLFPPSTYWLPGQNLHFFRQPDHTRIRRPGVRGGRRTMAGSDLRRVGDIVATTPLRTACDLGRSRPRAAALAALDALLGLGDFVAADLLAAVDRFRGHRGVVQLRDLAPLADGRAESVNESALRLLWLDADLPAPQLQIPIKDAWGRVAFRLDLGDSRVRYAAEFDGQEWHSTPEQRARDEHRRTIIRDQGWTLDVFHGDDLYAGTVPERLRRGHQRARERMERERRSAVGDGHLCGPIPEPAARDDRRGVTQAPTHRMDRGLWDSSA